MPATQKNRFLAIETKLGTDKVLIKDFSMYEQLGRLFRMEVELHSDDRAIKFEDVVGTQATLRLELPGGKGTRYFNGCVSRFVQTEHQGSFAVYHATLVPWLWFLTRTSDCRIFQNKKVPDIIEEVFKGHGLTDYKLKLSGAYQPWEYCVQYRETDFNFVSRLMEQEGIYYYFEHADGVHTLVLADSLSAHEAYEGYDTMIYRPPTTKQEENTETVTEWVIEKEVQSGQYALNDFNFTTPKASLIANANVSRQHAAADYEVYDYPGEYEQRSEGETYAKVRIQELQSQFETLRARATVRGVCTGCKFNLQRNPREDQNREYLITGAAYHVKAGTYETGRMADEKEFYDCQFTAIPVDQKCPYRPERLTHKPLIQGLQTAIVVGPAGEEIYTDEHARVKVQFHWDRYGKFDENSSCWMRVSQYWAGKAWGSMYIPRIGQEVIVEFLEGDPDRPIITGRVYNADQIPPYSLPGEKTKSTVKSNSSKGGGGSNEFRFEDKKGGEEVFLHGEKDWTIHIKDCENEVVGSSISTHAGSSISRNAGANISRTANVTISDSAGKDIVTTSGKNMSLKAGGSYELFTNLGIHLKAMNFVAAMIESGAKAAADAIKKGAVSGAAGQKGAEAKASGAASGAANAAETKGVAAMGPGIAAASAELTARQAQAEKNMEVTGEKGHAASKAASELHAAIASGAGAEVIAGAFMALAGAAYETYKDIQKTIEQMLPQIPSIVLWAMKDIDATALWSMSLQTKVKDISIEAKNKSVNIKGKQSVNLEAKTKDLNIKASKTKVVITGKEEVDVTAEDKNIVIEAKQQKVFVTAAKQIFLKCGSASISMADSGNIVIKGAKINLNGSDAVTVKGNPIKLN